MTPVETAIDKLQLWPLSTHHATIDGVADPESVYITSDDAVMVFNDEEDPLHLQSGYGYQEATVVPVVETVNGQDRYQIECGGHSHFVNRTYVDQLCVVFGTNVEDIQLYANPNDSDWPVLLELDGSSASDSNNESAQQCGVSQTARDTNWMGMVAPYTGK